MTASQAAGSAAVNAFARAAGLVLLAVGAALALIFAFAAALVVGLLVLGAAVAMRLAPRRRREPSGPEVLEARRTPTGWVVETATRSKA